jgi:predicted nucleotidyltransferase
VLAERWRNQAARLDFALCGDRRHDDTVRRVLIRAVDLLAERLPGDALVGVVLTGSFARGEGSVVAVDGRLRVLGDIEVLVIFRSEVEFYRFRAAMRDWSRELSRQVDAHIQVEIEFGPADLTYLRKRAVPSIFVHDLIEHGKVLWGPPGLLDEVPRFSASDIPRQDAVALLFNRTIEQLDTYDAVAKLSGDALWDPAYHRLKLVLDVAGSALAFAGRHVSSYAKRPAAFTQLLRDTPALADALPAGFEAELERAARVKILPRDGTAVLPAGLSSEERRVWIRDRVSAGVPAVTSVLRWQLQELLAVTDDLPGLLRAYRHTQPFSRRAWEWAKIVLRPTPAPVPLSFVRAARLFFTSTPRALLYSAGTLAYLDLVTPTARPRAISRMLFVRRRALRRNAEAQRRMITTLWRWCVRNS